MLSAKTMFKFSISLFVSFNISARTIFPSRTRFENTIISSTLFSDLGLTYIKQTKQLCASIARDCICGCVFLWNKLWIFPLCINGISPNVIVDLAIICNCRCSFKQFWNAYWIEDSSWNWELTFLYGIEHFHCKQFCVFLELF